MAQRRGVALEGLIEEVRTRLGMTRFGRVPSVMERAGLGADGTRESIARLFAMQVGRVSDALGRRLDGRLIFDWVVAKRGRYPDGDILKSPLSSTSTNAEETVSREQRKERRTVRASSYVPLSKIVDGEVGKGTSR